MDGGGGDNRATLNGTPHTLNPVCVCKEVDNLPFSSPGVGYPQVNRHQLCTPHFGFVTSQPSQTSGSRKKKGGNRRVSDMKVGRNKVNSWGVENRSNAFNSNLCQELLQTHLPLDNFSSQLQEDFLNTCISCANASAWSILKVLNTNLFIKEPKRSCPAFGVLAWQPFHILDFQ